MIESAKVRLVRCPKCKHILPELPDVSVYSCGGCGAVLQGKKNRKSGADTSSETSNEERVERVSLNSGNLLENETENFSNLSDISDADVKSNASSLNFGKRGSDAEKSRDHSKDRADKWFVETALDTNTNRDELGGIKMEKETGELKSHVQNASTSWRSERSSNWRFGERGEVEGFRRNPRTDIGGGMRYSQSTYSDEGPSNYGYGEPSRDGSSSLDGGNRVDYFGHDPARLIRQLDELKDRLNLSCDVTDKPKEKVPLDRRMFHEEAYEDSEAWFPTSSSGLRSSMPFFMPDKRVSEPPYFQHYTEPFPYNNRHEKGMHGSYPSMHGSNHIPGYEDVFGPQMLRQRRPPDQAPGHYRQQPPYAYFSGGYMEPISNPYEQYPHNPNLHHPSCSCFHCYTRHQQVPGSIPTNALLNRRFPDIPNDPMSYHRENPVAFGPRVYNPRTANPPPMPSHDSQSHASDLNTQTSDFVRHLPQREVLLNGRHYCRPLAGGAPFITCCNCCELLRLPKKILLVKKNQQKIRCGACSAIIFLVVNRHKIVASIHEETEKTSEEIDDSMNQLVDERPSNSHGHVNQYSENFSSVDYDNSAYDFQSMDREAGSVPTDQGLNSRKPERVQNLRSSPSMPENEGSQEGLIAPREVDNPLERPKKAVLSPPPAGSPLQEHFDYSSNNLALNSFGNGNQSSCSDREKVISSKAISRQSSVKDVSLATEMEVSFNEFSNTGVSQDSGDASREHDHPGINKGGEPFLAGIIKKDLRDSSRPNQTIEQGRNIVMVNGHLIPDRLVKKAEKLAGTIHPGEYWYDFYAGFWGVMGGRCLGIIPVRLIISETNFKFIWVLLKIILMKNVVFLVAIY
ncbi:hypothetical protein PVL29_020235 [Vitis rotundifolia]|uniref:Zinc-ribbon domain-containing protein n=1 Tax=Vitis rotundifolia TaxID=103349 RepID=A0AA38Z2N2_VITRO|nr:hypothetical protein PVL29_020235 [Vitis rotundifolia]